MSDKFKRIIAKILTIILDTLVYSGYKSQCISGQSENRKRQLTVHPKIVSDVSTSCCEERTKAGKFILNLLFYMRFSTSGGELDILHLQHCQFDISRPKLSMKVRFCGLITSFALLFADRHGQSGLKRPEIWHYFQ